MDKRKIVIACILFIFLFGCEIFQSPAADKFMTSDKCIPPIFNVAVPLIEPAANYEHKDLSPQPNWEFQTSIPELVAYDSSFVAGNNNDLWLTSPNSGTVLRYDINTGKWKEYDTINGRKIIPRVLFASKDGTIWGLGENTAEQPLTIVTSPILSRYDVVSDQFIFVLDKDGDLSQPQVYAIGRKLEEDNNGTLWMFITENNEDTLYSYNPSTQKAERHLSKPQGGNYDFAISPDGKIWYIDSFTNQLLVYDPSSNKITQFKSFSQPIDYKQIGSLVFDRNERLWLDTTYYIDIANETNPIIYYIVDSPTFITDNAGLLMQYGISTGHVILQSSNGWLWITSGSGLIRLDMAKGEWCLFTTGRAPVVEDENHILWTFYSNKLYKYPLEP
jgi:frataxin-like iron-binding protein CyaY